MVAPESPYNLDPNWRIDGSPIEALALVEYQERQESFSNLFLHIVRLYAYIPEGQQQTVHETYFSDDLHPTVNRLVVLMQEGAPESVALTRVIVNDESSGNDDGWQLSIKEYVVASSPKRIARSESLLVRGHDEHRWNPEEDTGPIMYKRNDVVEIHTYTASPEFTVPTCIAGMRHNIEQRIIAQELGRILDSLGVASLEAGYEVVYRSGK